MIGQPVMIKSMEETTYRASREPLTPPGGIDCHVDDMTVTVSADVTLKSLQAGLAKHSQWLPIDGAEKHSIGQLVSGDSTGPLRLGYGAWRDLLLGMQFRNGGGELITAGGRTVKNVAGYDLTKFMVGQRGAFGSLITLTTRTYRLPAGGLLARHAPDIRILNALIPTSLRPQWAVLTRDALLCGYLGDEQTLAFYRESLSRSGIEPAARSLAEDIAHRSSLWSVEGDTAFRASLPPARLPDFVSKLGESPWVADAAFGVVLGPGSVLHLHEMAGSLGGSIRVIRQADGTMVDCTASPAERLLIERIKVAFDPESHLAPLPWGTP